MSSTVGEQGVRFEVSAIDRRGTDLARPIRTEAKALQRPIDVIQRGLDGHHTVVSELWHGDIVLAPCASARMS